MGEMYPVVIRSFDRIYADEWSTQEHWKPKWERLKTSTASAPALIERVRDRATIADPTFTKRMRTGTAVGAALAIVPDAALVSRCVAAGAPLVLWARRGEDAAETLRELEPLLAGA